MIEGLHIESREDHQREHTIMRLEERWGIVISHERYEELCCRILARQAFRVRKLSQTSAVFLIAIDNTQVPVVFSKLTNQIATAWPKEAIEKLEKHYEESLYIRHRLKHHLPKILKR